MAHDRETFVRHQLNRIRARRPVTQQSILNTRRSYITPISRKSSLFIFQLPIKLVDLRLGWIANIQLHPDGLLNKSRWSAPR